MRRTVLALAILAVSGFASAADLPSTIAAVTVYQDRAVVTRHGSINLPAGEHDLVLSKLPARLLENSLQVSAKSTAQASVVDVKVRDALSTQSSNERIQQLEDQLQKLEQQEADLDDQAAVLENQRELISLMQQQAAQPSKEGARLSMDDIKNLQALSADTLTRTLAGLRSIAQQKTKLERDIEILRAQWQQLDGERSAKSKTVTVRVNMAQAGKLDLTLAYSVNGARWTPAYDARLRTADNNVELGYFGVIRQSTGEDWSKVALTLSTAKPALGGNAPTLQPWIVDVAAPPPPAPAPMAVKRAAAMSEASMLAKRAPSYSADDAASGGAAEPAQVEIQTAQLQNDGTSASFQIKAPTTLASDNSSQRVAITLTKLPATLLYQATPGLQETVYLTGSATNNTNFPLLAGPMSTFLNDAYIASSALKTVMPGQKLELALGADEGISIKRKLVNRFAESTGFSGNGKRVTYEYLLSVKNNKTTREKVSFQDRRPISRNEKIVVKLLSPSDKEVRREDDGKLAWNWDMEPGATRETTLKFSVDYPGDIDVSGI